MLHFGRVRLATQVEELRAVKADAIGAALQAMASLVREFDVAKDLDADTVPGNSRLFPQFLPTTLLIPVGRAGRLVAGQRLLVRVEDQQAPVPVHDYEVAARDVGNKTPQTDDRRD